MAVSPKNTKSLKKKKAKNIRSGIAHISASFNNTIVTFTDMEGNVLCWSSAGVLNFKGARKSTPYAAQLVAEDAGKKALLCGVKVVEVNISGPGSGRESALRSLETVGLEMTVVRDVTPIAHNGCRPPKRRRI